MSAEADRIRQLLGDTARVAVLLKEKAELEAECARLREAAGAALQALDRIEGHHFATQARQHLNAALQEKP